MKSWIFGPFNAPNLKSADYCVMSTTDGANFCFNLCNTCTHAWQVSAVADQRRHGYSLFSYNAWEVYIVPNLTEYIFD